MKYLKYLILGISIVITLLIIIYELPFTYIYHINSISIDLSNSNIIAIISDLHIENNPKNLTCIGNFLKKLNIQLLIIDGDLFDELNLRKLTINEIKSYLNYAIDRLGLESSNVKKIYYITALFNHDPIIENDLNISLNKFNILMHRGMAILYFCNSKIYILHGDYVIRNGILAAIINVFSTLFNKSLVFEKFTKSVLNISEDSWIILGHSHLPGIDYVNKIVNLGSWIDRFIKSSNTLALIYCENNNLKIYLVKLNC